MRIFLIYGFAPLNLENGMDLSKLSAQELEALSKEAAELAQKRKEDEKKALREELVEKIRAAGFTVDDIFPGSGPVKAVKTPASVKYRDPSNPENTWTGRGRKPGWLVEAEQAGRPLEDFAI